MASRALLGADELREKHRWGGATKVYTRRHLRGGGGGGLKNILTTVPNEKLAFPAVDITTDSTAAITAVETVNDTMIPDAISCGDTNVSSTVTVLITSPHMNNQKDGNKDNNFDDHFSHELLETVATEEANSSQQQQRSLSPLHVVSDDSSSHNQSAQVHVPNGSCERLTERNGCNRPIVSRVENLVRINLGANVPKCHIQELRRKLLRELDQVRNIVKRLDEKEIQVSGSSTDDATIDYYRPPPQRSLVRVHSEVGSVHHHDSDSRPFRQLSISVMENSHITSEFVEKEKRTPKVNQYYLNSEFLLAKDRLPSESNKKSKSSRGKKHNRQKGFGVDKNTNQALKSCSHLVARLLKHKYGWVFEKPVDAESLGLHDYHDIITNPMDLGTVKNQLASNLYKTPREFAEDVRLTFSNAMTYNPKGQDVHLMTEELLKIFEEKYSDIEAEYNFSWRYQLVQEMEILTPTSKKVQPPPPPFDGIEPIAFLKHSNSMGKSPAPKKPKAKDPNKRDMTYDEKQKLSTKLQSLPIDKLDSIVQIIKKRNSNLSQHDDEIEVDIDCVDAETLWELDRFVTNYKKTLSKHKRKAELALLAKATTVSGVSGRVSPRAVLETEKEANIETGAPHLQSDAQGDLSSGSSSSTSDSSSSSSDSDTASSSANGSYDRKAPRN
ncbi:transcription factor GTE4-like isoform X2 [Impatiens glandulifera]|uniref:transcription factor GTE4-like isoform X2 n=1 Tax=Impatiens glandulifera TaxID=253017 RepID=UPI001FB14880|nr:transcription factor GTE4-like isoform X2 [Impatiens glandulifera]